MATISDQGVGRISNRICQFQERKQQHWVKANQNGRFCYVQEKVCAIQLLKEQWRKITYQCFLRSGSYIQLLLGYRKQLRAIHPVIGS